MNMENLSSRIRDLAAQKGAIILAHNYQNPEIQDVADIVGDSLELSRFAATSDASTIVFCGVHFMAESASILSPEKTILLPDPTAGCPMADTIDLKGLRSMREKYPSARIVTYINSSALTKSESDVICTSSNAVSIVEKIDSDEIIFLPDRNLGSWVQKHTSKTIRLWDGFCPIHAHITVDEIKDIRSRYPDALLMVHPECSPEIIEMSDKVFSTGEMVRFVPNSTAKTIIVGTEIGMIHKLKKAAPHINFVPASERFVCPNMKKTDLDKVHNALEQNVHAVKVPEDIAVKARKALSKMLELS
jgi:quinolinate synthase